MAELQPVMAALTALDESELRALEAAVHNAGHLAPWFLAWLCAACEWELDRRVGGDYELLPLGDAMPVEEYAMSISAMASLNRCFAAPAEDPGSPAMLAVLDAIVALLQGSRAAETEGKTSYRRLQTPLLSSSQFNLPDGELVARGLGKSARRTSRRTANGSESRFKTGELVVLKTGGPLMTIRFIGDAPREGICPWLLCSWFDGQKTVEAIFDPRAIEPYRRVTRRFPA